MVDTTRTHQIDMGEIWDGWEGQWVKVRPYRSFAASERVDASLARAEAQADGTVRTTADYVNRAATIVEEFVVEWNLLDYEGNPITADRAGIQHELTPSDLIEQMVVAVLDYYEAQRPPKFRRPGVSA